MLPARKRNEYGVLAYHQSPTTEATARHWGACAPLPVRAAAERAAQAATRSGNSIAAWCSIELSRAPTTDALVRRRSSRVAPVQRGPLGDVDTAGDRVQTVRPGELREFADTPDLRHLYRYAVEHGSESSAFPARAAASNRPWQQPGVLREGASRRRPRDLHQSCRDLTDVFEHHA